MIGEKDLPDILYIYDDVACSTNPAVRLEYINERALDGWEVVSTHLDIGRGIPEVRVLFRRERKDFTGTHLEGKR